MAGRPVTVAGLIVGLFALAAHATGASGATATTTTRFVLRPATAPRVDALAAGCADVRRIIGSDDDAPLFEAFGTAADEAHLAAMGFEIVSRDAGRSLKLDPPAGYQDPQQLLAAVSALATAYPGRARVVDLTDLYGPGPTYEGNSIRAIKIAADVDDETKPALVLVSNHHARELVTPEIAVNISSRLVLEYESDPQVKRIVDTYQIYVLWTLNPDGLDYVWNVDSYWRKNRTPNRDGSYGVDLNRNYPIGWDFSCAGSSVPSSDTYRGPSAASEVEVQTMMAFQEVIRPVKVLDLHSYAREVRVIYGDCASLPATVDNYFQDVASTVADLIGYVQARSCCMGGNIHFAYHNQGSLTFLIETATAFQPPESAMRAELARVAPGILYFMDLPIPASGRVTDARTGAPVEAFFDIPSLRFELDEQRPSNPKTGAYHLWLPAGTYNVTVSVPGGGATSVLLTASASGAVRDLVV